MSSPRSNTIICSKLPQSLLNKSDLRAYFQDIANVVKVVIKPKSKKGVVEFSSVEDASNAIMLGGEYNGAEFNIAFQVKPVKLKEGSKRKPRKDPDPDWDVDPDVKAELEAMGSYTLANIPKKSYNLRPEKMNVDAETAIKPDRKRGDGKKSSKAAAASSASILKTTQETDLINILKQRALTIEDKYRVLEARDKLLRLRRNKSVDRTVDIRSFETTVGTCPDMCSEKERLMREVQHQVALYETQDGERTMNHSIAVKQYSRSSADQETPLPHELRNVDVLQMTMGYLMHRIMNLCDTPDVNLAEWYHFLWDRTRGIRKDITQQESCSQGSVALVEQCARFHIHCSARLVAEDPSTFDQRINTENLTKCLQTLKYMYHDLAVKGERCVNEAEFRTYVILLNLNDGNFMWEVQQLEPEIQREIKFALEVYSSLDKNNYMRFFKLVRSTSYLNACILLRYFIQVRTKALRTIVQCYTPRLPHANFPIEQLTNMLAFENTEATIDFVGYYGLKLSDERNSVVLNKRDFSLPDVPYTLDRAVNVIESKRCKSVGEVACGDVLPPPIFESHVVQCSFNDEGFLNLGEFDIAKDETDKAETFVYSSNDSNSKEGWPSLKVATSKLQLQQQEQQSQELLRLEREKLNERLLEENRRKEREQRELQARFEREQHQLQAQFEREQHERELAAQRLQLQQLQQQQEMERAMLQEEAKRIQERQRLEKLERERRRLQEEAEERERQIEIAKKQEQARQQEMMRARAEEVARQQRLKQEEEQRQREQERQRELERKLRDEEELKDLMIHSSVQTLLAEILTEVEDNYAMERLLCLKNSILSRKVVTKWRRRVASNKRKRKAIDQGPIWLNHLTADESAMQLYTSNQSLTLYMMKRYKKGVPTTSEGKKRDAIPEVDLAQLTAHELIKKSLGTKRLQNEIYWKIGFYYNDLAIVKNTLNSYMKWTSTDQMLLKQLKVDQNILTYCMHKTDLTHKTVYAADDANGLIFVLDQLTEVILDELLNYLNQLGDLVRMPVVFILQDVESQFEDEINLLAKNRLISEYDIVKCSFTGPKLLAALNYALHYLAKCCQPAPGLFLNTMKQFLSDNVGGELWQRIKSFSKWNNAYKQCVAMPNVAIGLYNEALSRLSKICTDNTRTEHASFPEVFKEFLPNHIPDFLPCDYKYFPDFWKSPKYNDKILSAFHSLKLPEYNGVQLDFEDQKQVESQIRNYCSTVFVPFKLSTDKINKIFYKIMGKVLQNSNQCINWLDIVEIVIDELQIAVDLSLGKEYKAQTVFNQLFVVYHCDALTSYLTDSWFYLKNPMIQQNISVDMMQERQDEARKQSFSEIDEADDDSFDINLAMQELTEREQRVDFDDEIDKREKCKAALDDLQFLLNDMEGSMSIQKQISQRFQKNVQSVLDNV